MGENRKKMVQQADQNKEWKRNVMGATGGKKTMESGENYVYYIQNGERLKTCY